MNELDTKTVIAFAETPEEREAVYRQRYRVYTGEMHLYQSVADRARNVPGDLAPTIASQDEQFRTVCDR